MLTKTAGEAPVFSDGTDNLSAYRTLCGPGLFPRSQATCPLFVQKKAGRSPSGRQSRRSFFIRKARQNIRRHHKELPAAGILKDVLTACPKKQRNRLAFGRARRAAP